MEVDEGMVAIVQSSRHAGLTVTLLPERQVTCGNHVLSGTGMKTTRGSRSIVETNTERISKNSRVPVSDIRHDSGYQFANCLQLPSHRQRDGFLGNGGGEMEQPLSGGTRSDRFMYHRRSSQFIHGPSLPMSHFMQSLRQYPHASSSAELVQRLLDYTHSKHRPKKHHSKSIKSLLRKSTSQQTNRVEKKHEKTVTNATKQLDRTVCAIGKRCSSQEELLNYTYDYLNSAIFAPRKTDVRYLTEIKRALRDKLREIIESKAEELHVCPRLQSRYNLHRRLHHRSSPYNASMVASKNTNTQVGSPTESRDATSYLKQSTSKESSRNACICPKTCVCNTNSDKENPKDSPRNLNISPTTCVCDTKKYKVQFLNVLKDWVKCIPVYPDFSEEDKKTQDRILNELTNNLKELDETQFNLKSKTEILHCLDVLPMWHPTDSNEDTLFKQHLADQLIKRLSKIDKKTPNTNENKDDKGIDLDSGKINSEDIKIIQHKYRPKQLSVKYSTDVEQYKKSDLIQEPFELFGEPPHKYENSKDAVKSEIADISPQKLRNTEVSTTKQITAKFMDRDREAQEKDILSDFHAPENRIINDEKEDHRQFLNGEFSNYNLDEIEVSENKSYDRNTKNLIRKDQQRVANLNKDDQEQSYFIPPAKEIDTFLRKKSEYKLNDQKVRESKNTDINNNGLTWKQQPKVSDRTKDISQSCHLNVPLQEDSAQYQRNKMNNYDPEDIEEIESFTNDRDVLALNRHEKVLDQTKDVPKLSHFYPKYQHNENETQQKEQREFNEWLNKENIPSDLQNIPEYTNYLKQQSPSDRNKTDDKNTYDEMKYSSHSTDQKELAKFQNNKTNEYDSDNIQDNVSTKDENSLGLIQTDRRKVAKWSKDKPEFSRLSLPEKKEFAYIPKSKMGEYDYENLEVNKLRQSEERENNEWLDKEAENRRFDSPEKPKFAKKIKQELPSDESMSSDETILLKNHSQQKVDQWNKEIPEFSQHKTKNTKNKIRESHLDESNTNDQSISGLINKWFQAIPKLAGENKLQHKKDLQDLALQLYEIQTSGEDFENIQIDMGEAITDWLQCILTKNNKRLSSTTFENLVSKLVNRINDTPKLNIYMQNERDMYEDFMILLKDIPGLDSNIDSVDNAIGDLVITLNDIRNSDEQLVETLTRDAINNFIETISLDTGVDLLPKDRELLKQTLLRRSKLEPQHRKRWNKQSHFGSSTPKASRRNSLSPNLSPIRNVSLEKEQTELDDYLNTLNNVIESWIKGLELNIGIVELRNLIRDIMTDIVDRQKYLKLSNIKKTEADELEHLKYQIFRRLNKLNVEDLPKIILRVGDLNKRISSVRTPELIQPFNRSDLTRRISNLVNSLKTWLANIPQDLTGSHKKPLPEEVFLDLAYKLTDLEYTINYYYIKNEICVWLTTIFSNIDKNTLNNLADSLIKHLINNLTVQNRTMTGSMYRLSLWDTLSKTLPSINLSAGDDLHALDLHKERLVDAFINLHYFAGDMVALEKFKNKLLDEVNKFCNEYLQRYPESPINPEELSKKLYSALRKVSLTDIETVRSELEQVRLKEEIMDWLQTVPLDKSKITESQLNAKVSDLAKRLHGLEKDKHIDPNNYNEMKFGILTWLQTLDVKDGGQITPLADVLIDKLKTTEKPRMLSISNIGKHGNNIIHQYAQSNLNFEDRAHLDRIRKRSDYNRGIIKTGLCKDVCVSAPLRECGMQTLSLNERYNDRAVSPQVIIKEYYWDSTSTNVSQRSLGSRRPMSTCPPCNKISETAPQVKIKRQFTKNSNAQTDQVFNNAYPKSSQAEKICDNILVNDSLGCLADRAHSSRLPPSCYFPGKLRTSTPQRINLPSEIIGCRRGDNCSNNGQQTYAKCRGRNFNYRPHCNGYVPESSTKNSPNCVSSCPYPSNLFFKKEFS